MSSSHLPVVVDPSHGTGKWKYVTDMAKAGVAAGADGLIVEVHPRPEEALSDGPQSLRPEVFEAMMKASMPSHERSDDMSWSDSHGYATESCHRRRRADRWLPGDGVEGGGRGSEVIGVARRPETIEEAKSVGAIDRGTLDLAEGVREADVVILAAPVLSIVPLFRALRPS